ncbi:hypothetical protein [Actinoplanes campanulatus]
MNGPDGEFITALPWSRTACLTFGRPPTGYFTPGTADATRTRR